MNPSLDSVQGLRPIRCLLIQMATLAETLQSLMAAKAAQQLYPQLEIHFVIHESSADAISRVPWVKNSYVIPSSELFSEEKSEGEVLQSLVHWLSSLVREPWDIVLNWSFSESSSYLTALIPSRVKLGYSRKKDSSFLAADGWSQYVQGIVQTGVSQNIHFTDILTTQLLTALQIHVGEASQTNPSKTVSSRTFFKLNYSFEAKKLFSHSSPMRKIIAFQINGKKQGEAWSSRNWAKLAQLILEEKPEYEIYLLAAPGFEENGDEILSVISENHPDLLGSVHCLLGKTNFDLWTSILSRSEWLISSDRAAVHLASVLGIRVLSLSLDPRLGSAHLGSHLLGHRETGPYGNGHYVLKGDSQALSAESVYGVWLCAQTDDQENLRRNFLKLLSSEQLNSISVYRSRIRSPQDGGGVVYEILNSKAFNMEDWFAQVMGYVARSWYCGWVPKMDLEVTEEALKQWPLELQSQLFKPKLIQELRELKDATEVLIKILEKAKRTAVSLSEKSSQLVSTKVMELKDREEINQLGKTLADLDLLMERLSQAKPVLRGFAQMNKIFMHHLKGETLKTLSEETILAYQMLGEGVSILKEWIDYTLNLVKPISLSMNKTQKLSLLREPTGEGLSV